MIRLNTNETLSLDTKSVELQTTLSWPASGSKTLRLMDDGEHYCDLIADSDTDWQPVTAWSLAQ